MKASWLRALGPAWLALLFSTVIHAQSFEGSTEIDFDALGGTSYNLSFFASTVYDNTTTGWAYAGFGPLYASSVCNAGEAGAGMHIFNITKIGGQWVADTVVIMEMRADASGYEQTVYNNVALPSRATVYGYAECGPQTADVHGWLDVY